MLSLLVFVVLYYSQVTLIELFAYIPTTNLLTVYFIYFYHQ